MNPIEHKPFVAGPCTIGRCGIQLDTPAEQFLHECLHAESWDPGKHNLSKVPYVLMPIIAETMRKYAAFRMRELAADCIEVLGEAREMLGVFEDNGGHDSLGGKGYLATIDHMDDLKKRCRELLDELERNEPTTPATPPA